MRYELAELAELLVSTWQYQPSQSLEVADKLLKMDDGIRESFEKWLDDKKFPDFPIFSGFSPDSLSRSVPIKPPAIFLLLDWIRRDPKEALSAMEDEYGKSFHAFKA